LGERKKNTRRNPSKKRGEGEKKTFRGKRKEPSLLLPEVASMNRDLWREEFHCVARWGRKREVCILKDGE